jgi:tRNA pseudouridine55 synthase
MDGFLNLNKPLGFTSHDCVAKVRRLLRQKRIGHAGTLDPAASGVLPIALGRATRLLQFLSTDKAYQATVRLGIQTTTDDMAGEVLSTYPIPSLTLDAVTTALQPFHGQIQQIPPRYSAIQVQGKRLYDLARAGQEIAVAARTVEIYRIDVLAWRSGDFPELDLAIVCGAGTYIRAIARDLGAALHCGGTLAALTRTYSSGFDLETSLTFEQLDLQLQTHQFQPISPGRVLQHLPSVNLPEEVAYRWCLGQSVAVGLPKDMAAKAWRVHHDDGRFLGVGDQRITQEEILLHPWVVIEVPSPH